MKKKLLLLLSIISFCLMVLSSYAMDSISDSTSITEENQTTITAPMVLNPTIERLIEKKGGLYQPPRGDVRLLVISDLNSAYGSTEYEDEVHLALQMIPFWSPDLVLGGGDMIAGQKRDLTPTQIRAMWSAFDRQIAQPLRDLNLPFGFTIGNHDASGSFSIRENRFFFQQERDLAREYWLNPKHDTRVNFVDRTSFPFYYTFKEKDIFFLVWDASSSYIPPERLQWVEQALNSDSAKGAKMRMAIGHLPLYGIAKGRDRVGEVLNNADELRTLLEKNHVHTYISGHQHAYYPAHKGNLQMLHAGVLGSGPRALIDGDAPPMKNLTVVDINFDDPELTTYTTYNLKTLEVINDQELPPLLKAHNGTIYRRDIEIKKG